MRPEKFTEQAQEVLAASQELVRRYRHNQWDVEHVLLALLEQEKGITRDIFQMLGVDIDVVRKRVGATLEGFPKVTYEAGQIYATPRISALLENANKEADRLKDEFVSTEHLLIAIAGETEGKAAAILAEFDITKEKIYPARQTIRGANQTTHQHGESEYRFLEEYGYDLTDLAHQAKLRPVEGRDDAVQRVMEILTRRTKRNPVLVGARSVDKFSIVEELARRIAIGSAPSLLQEKKIVALDLGKLVAGTKFRGEFEERVQAVLREVCQSKGRIIPYFDELWVGVAEGGLDIGSMLKFPLAVGEVQCIAATTAKYLEYFKEKGMLARQFQVIPVDEAETELEHVTENVAKDAERKEV